MKRISSIFSLLLVLAIFGFSGQIWASPTNVGSTLSVDTQWDQSGSPYIIQNSVLVPPGVTLEIGPGVQVVFQGPATLHVAGEIKMDGSAANPAVIDMTNGGLQNAFFIDGGEAQLSNTKVLNGVFLVQDATIRMDSSTVTRGSGLYLKGNATAYLKNNTFYGNATGVVFDGTVEAFMRFNTLVQNTYGLYFKHYSKVNIFDNSIHDNDSDVVNIGSRVSLGGNYWGSFSPISIQNKIRGSVSISPIRGLKDILRSYLQTELPVITQSMSNRAQAEDIRLEKEEKQALTEFDQKQNEIRLREIRESDETLTPIATATSTDTPIPTDTFTPVEPAIPPVELPTSTPVPVIPTPVVEMPTPVPTEEATSIPFTALTTPEAPQPPNVMMGLPSPPAVLPTAIPETPDLGNLATATPATPEVTESELTPTPSPTPQDLGGPPVTSGDLASMIATAQAASTESTLEGSPTAQTVPPEPGGSLNGNPPSGSSNSVPLPPTLPSDDSGSVAVNTPISTDTPTDIDTVLPVPSDTPTMTWTNTPVDTDTSTPTVVVSNNGGSSGGILVATVGVSSSNVSTPTSSGSELPIGPPPPDFSGSSNNLQPPMVFVPTISSVPSNTSASTPSETQNSDETPTPDVDVNGLQAPPMDSGLDFSNPPK